MNFCRPLRLNGLEKGYINSTIYELKLVYVPKRKIRCGLIDNEPCLVAC